MPYILKAYAHYSSFRGGKKCTGNDCYAAGKSTTIECIWGTKKADSGHVSVLDMNPLTDRKK